MSQRYTMGFTVFELPSELKNEFKLLPFGPLSTVDETMTLQFTPEDARSVVDAFKTRGIDMLMDYEHQSIGHLEGFEMFKSPNGQAPAAAWVGDLEIRPDGLWATKVKWTPEAATALKTGAYRYFSPVVFHPNGHIRVVYNLGLTNEPRLKDIPALAARCDLGKLLESYLGKESSMSFKDDVVGALGIKADANEPDILSAIKGAVDKASQVGTLSAFKTQAETSQAKVTELTSQLTALTTERDTAKAEAKAKADEISAFKTQAEKDRPLTRDEAADLVVDLAEQTGRITTAQRDHYKKLAAMDPKAMLAAFKTQPVGSVVPIAKISGTTTAQTDVPAGEVNPNRMSAFKTDGMPDDRIALHKKIEAKMAENPKLTYAQAREQIGL